MRSVKLAPSKTRTINIVGTKTRTIDPAEVAKALGAEPITDPRDIAKWHKRFARPGHQ